MYFEAVKIESISVRTKYGKIKQEFINLVNEFIKSEHEAAEIKEYTSKSAKSFVAFAKKAIAAENITSVRIVLSGNKVFIVKKRNQKGALNITNKQ